MLQRFRQITAAAAYCGAFSTVDHAARGDNGGKPAYRLRFRGTAVSVHAVLDPGSGQAAISVDGTLVRRAGSAVGIDRRVIG